MDSKNLLRISHCHRLSWTDATPDAVRRLEYSRACSVGALRLGVLLQDVKAQPGVKPRSLGISELCPKYLQMSFIRPWPPDPRRADLQCDKAGVRIGTWTALQKSGCSSEPCAARRDAVINMKERVKTLKPRFYLLLFLSLTCPPGSRTCPFFSQVSWGSGSPCAWQVKMAVVPTGREIDWGGWTNSAGAENRRRELDLITQVKSCGLSCKDQE